MAICRHMGRFSTSMRHDMLRRSGGAASWSPASAGGVTARLSPARTAHGPNGAFRPHGSDAAEPQDIQGATSPSCPAHPGSLPFVPAASAASSFHLAAWHARLASASFSTSAGASAAPASTGLVPSSSADSDLLWAGYSDLLEQLRHGQSRQELLQQQVAELKQQLQGALAHRQPANALQAASYLLFFLAFINCAGFIAAFRMGFFVPFAKQQGSLWLRDLIAVALPITNTAVVLIFCVYAVKAALSLCLRW